MVLRAYDQPSLGQDRRGVIADLHTFESHLPIVFILGEIKALNGEFFIDYVGVLVQRTHSIGKLTYFVSYLEKAWAYSELP